jgi:4-carboxymuconolactone decarboxylase
MLNLAMLTALGKAAEVKLHVRGAINNGLTVDDIKEVLFMPRSIAASPPVSMRSRPRTKCSRRWAR